MNDGIRPAVAGCLLGRTGMGDECTDCSKCGWNPNVSERRKRTRRQNEKERLEVIRLREARAHTAPDQNGWYSVKWALPELMERVIVTDGAFVGEAFLSSNGWERFGMTLPAEALGIFRPVAWMPLPQPIGRKTK